MNDNTEIDWLAEILIAVVKKWLLISKEGIIGNKVLFLESDFRNRKRGSKS